MPDAEMPTTDARPSERELRKRLDADVRRVRELQPKVDAKKATGYEVTEWADTARRANVAAAELRERRAERASDEHGLRSVWKLGRRGHPLTRARELEAPALDGVTLEHERLTDEEVAELRRLVKVRGREAETPEQAERFEALVGKAADEPGVLARRRDDLEREAAMRAEATRLARAFLPVRRDPEPGSVELPRFLHDWLVNGQPDTFDVTDLGVLAALAFAFANESAELLAHARFEGVGEYPRIVVGKGASGGLRLAYGADDAGVRVRDSLAKLQANRWAEVEVVRGVTTIRPGERMRALFPKSRG